MKLSAQILPRDALCIWLRCYFIKLPGGGGEKGWVMTLYPLDSFRHFYPQRLAYLGALFCVSLEVTITIMWI